MFIFFAVFITLRQATAEKIKSGCLDANSYMRYTMTITSKQVLLKSLWMQMHLQKKYLTAMRQENILIQKNDSHFPGFFVNHIIGQPIKQNKFFLIHKNIFAFSF